MQRYENLDQVQVEKLAEELAGQLRHRSAVIGLIGNLGAGKTTFAKAFAKIFKITKTSSPTFVVNHQYQLKNRVLYHLDFYRLLKEKELVPLGLDEIFYGKNLVLIEWADKFPKIMRKCDILISLKVKPSNKRDVTIRAKK